MNYTSVIERAQLGLITGVERHEGSERAAKTESYEADLRTQQKVDLVLFDERKGPSKDIVPRKAESNDYFCAGITSGARRGERFPSVFFCSALK